ncbi:MAG: universal stress protein [Promethearchaeota archaeon]
MDAPIFQKILVGVDGSKDSYAAARYGIKLARSTGGAITFLYVVTEDLIKERFDTSGIKDLIAHVMAEQARTEELGREVFGEVEELARQVLPPERIHTRMRGGFPHEEFLEEIKEGNHDLVILGQQGASKSFTTVFGEISKRIVNESSVPLLIVKK